MTGTRQPCRIIGSGFGPGEQRNSVNSQQSTTERDIGPRSTVEKVMAGNGTANGGENVVQGQLYAARGCQEKKSGFLAIQVISYSSPF